MEVRHQSEVQQRELTNVEARQPRHNRDEVRDLLLQTGRTILIEEGLGTGAEVLTFKRVFDRVEHDTGIRLTNASVIRRLWENLADFQADVLVELAQDENQDEFNRTVGAVDPVLSAVDLSSPETRDRALRELCRVGGAANVNAVRQSSYWPVSIAVWALAAFDEPLEHRKRIEMALVAGYDAFTDRIAGVYAALAALLGYRLREQFTLHQFAIAADALGQGCGLRDRVDQSKMEGIVRKSGPDGEAQEWTLFAVAFEGLVRQFFEIDPNWEHDQPDDSPPSRP
jgi:hypothetical protein